MSSKTGVSHVMSPYTQQVKKKPPRRKSQAGEGIADILTSLAKKAITEGASGLCTNLAKKILGNGVTRSGDGVTRSGDGVTRSGDGVTRSGDGRRKKKKTLKGGCSDCTMKLKKHLENLKL